MCILLIVSWWELELELGGRGERGVVEVGVEVTLLMQMLMQIQMEYYCVC